MSQFDIEVASQPDCWREATRLAATARADLPVTGARVAAVGCGTSLYVAQAYAAWREDAGQGETDAFPASQMPAGRQYDAVVAFSRSGTTTEVLRCLAGIHPRTRRHAVTAVAGTPIETVVDAVVRLPFADETSLVQTRFATTTLALIRSVLGHDMAAVIASAAQVLSDPPAADPADYDQFVFIGDRAGAALAQEAGLKIREATGAWSEAYPAMEFRHGPISTATKRSLVWAVGPVDPTLTDEIAETAATYIHAGRDPLVELVAIHRFTSLLAGQRQRNIDRPPYLNRSVVLA